MSCVEMLQGGYRKREYGDSGHFLRDLKDLLAETMPLFVLDFSFVFSETVSFSAPLPGLSLDPFPL